MTQRVIILGAGGFAREVADIFRDMPEGGGYQVLGFVDRDSSRKGELLNDLHVLGSMDDVGDLAGVCAVAGSGDIRPRRAQMDEIARHGLDTVTIVHPSVITSPFVVLGEGSIVCAGTILTNNIKIGVHTVINLGVTVGHDVTIGDCCVLSPGVHVSGWVTMGDDCYIGTGAVILPRVSIGDGAVIGAGAVVNKDVAAGDTVVGIPARPLKPGR